VGLEVGRLARKTCGMILEFVREPLRRRMVRRVPMVSVVEPPMGHRGVLMN